MIDSGEQNVYVLKKKIGLIWTDSNTQGGDGDIDDNIHYKEGIWSF